jgi:hypothetical protein
MNCLSSACDEPMRTVRFSGSAATLILLVAGCASQPQVDSPPRYAVPQTPLREQALSTVGPAASWLVPELKPLSRQPPSHETEVGTFIELDSSAITVE